MKTAQSATSLTVPNTNTQKSGTAPPAVLTTVNSSRLTTTKAGAKGIAEIFLASEEMAEQNVPVIRTLVAETAFTSKYFSMSTCMTFFYIQKNQSA